MWLLLFTLMVADTDVVGEARLTADAIALADTTRLTVNIEGPAPLRVMLPDSLFRGVTLTQLRITPLGEPTISPQPNQRERWTQSFTVDPFAAGELQILFEAIRVRGGVMGRPKTLVLPGVSLRVTSSLSKGDLTQLRPGTTIEPAPPAPERSTASRWWWLLLLAPLLPLIAWRWRSRPVPVLGLREQTLLALRQLDEQSLAPALYLAAVCDCLRSFIESRWQLPATRRTTSEMLMEFRQAQHVPAGWIEPLARVLQVMDRAKFGTGAIDPVEAHAVGALVAQLVRECAEDGEVEKIGESR